MPMIDRLKSGAATVVPGGHASTWGHRTNSGREAISLRTAEAVPVERHRAGAERRPAAVPEHVALTVRYAWMGMLGLAAVMLTVTAFGDFALAGGEASYAVVFLALAAVAFFGEYIDSSLGMGYGTVLTPVLLILGYSPLEVVPCLLLSETLSGLFGGLLHHRLGNVDLRWGTNANVTTLVLVGLSVVGAAGAVVVAVQLPPLWVKLYVGTMIVAVSLFLLLGRRALRAYSWRRILPLGVVAAFNKGISGGGYGPLVTGGQVLLGVDEKSAIGTTTVSEGLVSLVALTLYLILQGGAFDWSLGVPLIVGAMLSVPAATWTVRILPPETFRPMMGWATLFLGTLLLVKLFV